MWMGFCIFSTVGRIRLDVRNKVVLEGKFEKYIWHFGEKNDVSARFLNSKNKLFFFLRVCFFDRLQIRL
jgi:hypothetical protein